MNNNYRKKIEDMFLKKAFGYVSKEVVEEYCEEEGALKLTKRKVTVKNVPPDLQAAKILLEKTDDDGLSGLSDQQLQAEKERLIKLITEKKEE